MKSVFSSVQMNSCTIFDIIEDLLFYTEIFFVFEQTRVCQESNISQEEPFEKVLKWSNSKEKEEKKFKMKNMIFTFWCS